LIFNAANLAIGAIQSAIAAQAASAISKVEIEVGGEVIWGSVGSVLEGL
jgi:hypothetical protein